MEFFFVRTHILECTRCARAAKHNIACSYCSCSYALDRLRAFFARCECRNSERITPQMHKHTETGVRTSIEENKLDKRWCRRFGFLFSILLVSHRRCFVEIDKKIAQFDVIKCCENTMRENAQSASKPEKKKFTHRRKTKIQRTNFTICNCNRQSIEPDGVHWANCKRTARLRIYRHGNLLNTFALF